MKRAAARAQSPNFFPGRRIIRHSAVAAFIILLLFGSTCFASDIPTRSESEKIDGRVSTALRENSQGGAYYWKSDSAGSTAQLLTLFCRSCLDTNGTAQDVPLVAVLRDTLGDADPRNDRVEYIWLLTYTRPNLGQRLLSAIPFFYWRVGEGSSSGRSPSPLLDLTAPQQPVFSELRRDLLQWTVFDPMTTPIRATSRAYRTNELDHERLHLEEAISYLTQAPVSGDPSLTETERNTVIARLELRKRLLGGLATERQAERVGEAYAYEQERIRSRNWEILRECAESAGLLFDPLDIAGTTGHYGMLWFPLDGSFQSRGTSLGPVWKILNIKNPWSDPRLRALRGPIFTRALDENGSLRSPGVHPSSQIRLAPLAVYSFDYPKLPLLLVDFRDKLHVRRHEMTQRSINEITAGVIGISHFTNWYYYVAADLYDFVASRHGTAVNQAARLDCYSEFRVAIALDHELDPALRNQIQHRIDSLAVNPLETSPAREMQAAIARYAALQADARDGGRLLQRLNDNRRAEIAAFRESKKARVANLALHDLTFGLYTRRVKQSPTDLAQLDRDRRIQYDLMFLDSLATDGTAPEVICDSARIQASITELSSLIPDERSAPVRVHAIAAIDHVRRLSHDLGIQADCLLALAAMQPQTPSQTVASPAGILASPAAFTFRAPSHGPKAHQ